MPGINTYRIKLISLKVKAYKSSALKDIIRKVFNFATLKLILLLSAMPNNMKEQFAQQLFAAHAQAGAAIPKSAICKFTDDILQLFFPQLSEQKFASEKDILLHLDLLGQDLQKILRGMPLPEATIPELLASAFINQLPGIYDLLLKDAEAIANEDPAALNV